MDLPAGSIPLLLVPDVVPIILVKCVTYSEERHQLVYSLPSVVCWDPVNLNRESLYRGLRNSLYLSHAKNLD